MLERVDFRFSFSNPTRRIEQFPDLRAKRELCLKDLFDDLNWVFGLQGLQNGPYQTEPMNLSEMMESGEVDQSFMKAMNRKVKYN